MPASFDNRFLFLSGTSIGGIMSKRLLLISNSTCFGRDYLEHCRQAIQRFLDSVKSVVFIPYALQDWDGYTAKARVAFEGFGIKLVGIHERQLTVDDVRHAEAFFVGGGNTFRLLNSMISYPALGTHHGVFDLVQEAIENGARYIGTSAGANLAGPTIKTTNDMPIVEPPTFNALWFVPFQINPHYLDADPNSRHMGETRERRITEFHEEELNFAPVIGLREGAWIHVDGDIASLGGEGGAKFFGKGQLPREWSPGTSLTFNKHKMLTHAAYTLSFNHE